MLVVVDVLLLMISYCRWCLFLFDVLLLFEFCYYWLPILLAVLRCWCHTPNCVTMFFNLGLWRLGVVYGVLGWCPVVNGALGDDLLWVVGGSTVLSTIHNIMNKGFFA